MKAKRLLFGMAVGAFLALSALPVAAKGRITAFPYLKTNYSLISASGIQDGKCTLVIKSAEGEVVYSIRKKEHSGNFQKVLDLRTLEDGEYSAMVKKDGKALFSCDFYLKDGKITAPENSRTEKADLSARIFSQDDLLFVSFLNHNRDLVNMKIEDLYGNELYTSSLKDEVRYSGKFDLSAFPKGTYYVSLNSGNNQSRYVFSKEQ